jgi:hypothetical protein
MAYGGDDIDTLALMFDKLQYIFRGYDSYIQNFTDMQSLYKQGKLSESDYYNGMIDAVLKYSALEFLGLKSMFEIKKALNRMHNPSANQRKFVENIGQNSIASFISAKSLPSSKEVQSEKQCTLCGNRVSSLAKFCVKCGNKV